MFPMGQSGRDDVKLTTHLHVVQRLRMHVAINPLPQKSPWRGAWWITKTNFLLTFCIGVQLLLSVFVHFVSNCDTEFWLQTMSTVGAGSGLGKSGTCRDLPDTHIAVGLCGDLMPGGSERIGAVDAVLSISEPLTGWQRQHPKWWQKYLSENVNSNLWWWKYSLHRVKDAAQWVTLHKTDLADHKR
jgi:hypothetical protein